MTVWLWGRADIPVQEERCSMVIPRGMLEVALGGTVSKLRALLS